MESTMECKDDMEVDSTLSEVTTSDAFTFSEPNVLLGSPKAVSFDIGPEHVFGASATEKTVFTFAAPAEVTQPNLQYESNFDEDVTEGQYKPKITRSVYQPPIHVFTQALKDTAIFEQLKKNSRSQTKINKENSLTCTSVPQDLLVPSEAMQYFRERGNVLQIAISPKKQVIYVSYPSKEEAASAMQNCGEYMGENFNVGWTNSNATPRPMKASIKKKESQKKTVSNFLKGSDNEIKSELDAMMNLEYNMHSGVKPILERVGKVSNVKGMAKTTMKVEKTAAKTEKYKTDSQISDLLPNASVEELENILRQAALTSEDKYKVLEARDRLMRLKQIKSHNLAVAKVMTGVCPDMCPEKERLMRESRRQVALYEQVDGCEYKINHAIAVKQYSRSSADQEEPMSHELRPVKSLKMTMSYLLHEIADLCDQQGTNLGEWYHFLWDRTRGIRKDITQQELCCIDTVQLVEQCARFHIVCSERLCSEELSVFDKKINSDNLTKCLQTLKYMYHDLRVKGITCQNECEFWAYIILLNLNNGTFMWDLQRLPVSIQKSAEVRFAIEVYSALDSNNYCKFYKLVRETTYLNACILLRYFNQVRIKALSVMVKAYCRTTSTAYPLYELIDILGFEDENETIYFCEQIGLHVSKDELHVLLNRQNFTMPVLVMEQNRASNLIEYKRISSKLSIGETISGGNMPEKTYKYHKPHNSFSPEGYLLSQSINAEDQSMSVREQIDPYEFVDDEVKPEKIETEASAAAKPDSVSLLQSTTSISTTDIFESKLPVASKPLTLLGKNSKPETSTVLQLNNEKRFDPRTSIFNALKQDSTLSTSKQSEPVTFGSPFNATSVISKPSNVFSKQPEVLENKFAITTNKNPFSGTIQGNIFAKPTSSSTIFSSSHSSTQGPLTSFATTPSMKFTSENKMMETKNLFEPVGKVRPQKEKPERTDAEKQKLEEQERAKKMNQIEEKVAQIFDDLQMEVVETCCSDIVRKNIEKLNTLNASSKEVNDMILNEVVHDMCSGILKEEILNKQRLHEMTVKIKNRVIRKYFCIWKHCMYRKRQQRKALDDTPVWLQHHSVEECAKLFHSKDQDLVIQNMRRKKQTGQATTKSSIASLAPVEVIIYSGLKENLKSLDIDMCPNMFWKLVIAWPDLENKAILRHHKKIMNEYLYLNNHNEEPTIKLYRPNEMESLHICVRHFEGLVTDDDVLGSDALLFITDGLEDIKSVCKRLTKTVLSRHKFMPIPLVFIVLGNETLGSQNREIVSDLETLLKSGYLSEYTIMFERNLNDKTILNLTQSSVLWLTANRSPPSPLEMDYLQDVYDTCLTEELWLRIMADSSYNTKLLYALKEPNFVINLHNEAVSHLIDIILDPETFMYTPFAPEFQRFLSYPYTIPCSYEFFDDIWKEEDYKAKLETVMSSFMLPQWKYPWSVDDSDELYQNITHYCQRALSGSSSNLKFSNILSNLFLTSGTPAVSSFIDVVLYIVKEKIGCLNEELNVIYNRNHIKHFRTLPWWFKSDALAEYRIPVQELVTVEGEKENDAIGPIAKKRKLRNSKDDVPENDVTATKLEPLAVFCENTRTQIMEIHNTSKKIDDCLKATREQSCLLEERIRHALFGDSEPTSDNI